MIGGYLAGYALFFKYVLPRVALNFKRSWLALAEGYSFFLESSLFVVLFAGLSLAVYSLAARLDPTVEPQFALIETLNPYEVDRRSIEIQTEWAAFGVQTRSEVDPRLTEVALHALSLYPEFEVVGDLPLLDDEFSGFDLEVLEGPLFSPAPFDHLEC